MQRLIKIADTKNVDIDAIPDTKNVDINAIPGTESWTKIGNEDGYLINGTGRHANARVYYYIDTHNPIKRDENYTNEYLIDRSRQKESLENAINYYARNPYGAENRLLSMEDKVKTTNTADREYDYPLYRVTLIGNNKDKPIIRQVNYNKEYENLPQEIKALYDHDDEPIDKW